MLLRRTVSVPSELTANPEILRFELTTRLTNPATTYYNPRKASRGRASPVAVEVIRNRYDWHNMTGFRETL